MCLILGTMHSLQSSLLLVSNSIKWIDFSLPASISLTNKLPESPKSFLLSNAWLIRPNILVPAIFILECLIQSRRSRVNLIDPLNKPTQGWPRDTGRAYPCSSGHSSCKSSSINFLVKYSAFYQRRTCLLFVFSCGTHSYSLGRLKRGRDRQRVLDFRGIFHPAYEPEGELEGPI